MKLSELEIQMENTTKQKQVIICAALPPAFHDTLHLSLSIQNMMFLWSVTCRSCCFCEAQFKGREKWSSAVVKYLSSPNCQMILQLLT